MPAQDAPSGSRWLSSCARRHRAIPDTAGCLSGRRWRRGSPTILRSHHIQPTRSHVPSSRKSQLPQPFGWVKSSPIWPCIRRRDEATGELADARGDFAIMGSEAHDSTLESAPRDTAHWRSSRPTTRAATLDEPFELSVGTVSVAAHRGPHVRRRRRGVLSFASGTTSLARSRSSPRGHGGLAFASAQNRGEQNAGKAIEDWL